ncbi:MAG: hypothetical protein Q9M32_06665 [Sulfurimonas sp.]|nr:hypothetical protein [Sulfurimonas sp.]
MKKILNIIFLSFIFLASFIIFFPKEKVYYFAQEKLAIHEINIESKIVESRLFSLDLQESTLLLSGSPIAKIKHLNISLFGMRIEDIRGIGAFEHTVPSLTQVDIAYKPGVFAVASGDFGEITASFKLSDMKIILKANMQQATKNKYSMIFAKFKKVGDSYVYEISL